MTTAEEFNIIPINDNILVRMDPPRQITEGGIILPNQEKKSSTRMYQEPAATIVAISDSESMKDFPGKVGDKILARGSNVVDRGQERLIFARRIDVIAVLKKKK